MPSSIIIQGPNGEREVFETIAGSGKFEHVLAPGERVVHIKKEGKLNAFILKMQQDIKAMETDFKNEGLLLGDAIAKATKFVGIEPCSGCTRRQQWLNEWHKRGKAFVSELVSNLKLIPN